MKQEFEELLKWKTDIPVKLEFKIGNINNGKIQLDGFYYDIPFGELLSDYLYHTTKPFYKRKFNHDLLTKKYLSIMNEFKIKYTDL